MRVFALTAIFVLGIIAGITWVDDTVTFLLTVAIFALLASAVMYEPSREQRYAREYRKSRDRRMREVHLGHDLGDYGRPD